MSNFDECSKPVLSSGKCWPWLVVIFLLAFSLRLLANVMFEDLHDGPNFSAFGSDGVEFNALASNLARHQEYAVQPGQPTSFRAPGFPFALAAVYGIFGADNFPAARIFFCLIGALLTVVVFLLGREVADTLTALLAAGLVAVYPNLLYYTIHFASEPLYILLSSASVWTFLRAVKSRSWGQYAASGFILGLATLTRPAGIFFVPFFALGALLLARRDLRRTVLGVCLYGAAALLAITPWTIRNYVVHERFVFVTSNGGSTFWGSNNQLVLADPEHQGDWVSTERLGEQKAAVHKLPNEIDRDHLEWEYGKQFIALNPQAVPRLLWYKLRAFWWPIPTTPNQKFNMIISLSYGALLPLIVAGFWLLLKQRPHSTTQLAILTLPIQATVLATVVFYGSARFRCTIEPFLLVFAAVAITALLKVLEAASMRLRSPWLSLKIG